MPFPPKFFLVFKVQTLFFLVEKKTNKNTQKVSTRRNALPEGFRPRCLDHFALLLSGRQQHLRCRSASGARTGFGRCELEALRGPRLGLQVGMEPGSSLQLPGVPPPSRTWKNPTNPTTDINQWQSSNAAFRMPLTHVCQTGGASTQKAGTLYISSTIHYWKFCALLQTYYCLNYLSIYTCYEHDFSDPKTLWSSKIQNQIPTTTPRLPRFEGIFCGRSRGSHRHTEGLWKMWFFDVFCSNWIFSLFFLGNATQDTMHLNGQIFPNICVKQRCASACYSRLPFHKVLLEIPLQPGTPSKPGF